MGDVREKEASDLTKAPEKAAGPGCSPRVGGVGSRDHLCSDRKEGGTSRNRHRQVGGYMVGALWQFSSGCFCCHHQVGGKVSDSGDDGK